MSYTVYTSFGIVLSRFGIGEKNLIIRVLTEDIGLISAKVISARNFSSKLRPGTTPFSFGEFSFVRGKESFRLVNCLPQENLYFSLGDKKEHKIFFSKVAKVLLSMVPSEEKNKKLFNIVSLSFKGAYLCDKSLLPFYEISVMVRILASLGYIPDIPSTRPIIESTVFDSSLAKHVKENVKDLHELISQAFSVSHLV